MAQPKSTKTCLERNHVKKSRGKLLNLNWSKGLHLNWRREWQTTPVFLLGKSYGQRNLAGYGPWGHNSRR